MMSRHSSVAWMCLSSGLLLVACSHEWDALDMLPGNAGAGGDATTSSSSSTGPSSSSTASSSSSGIGSSSSSGSSGSSSSSGGGGAGGNANDCGPLLPPVTPCDNLTGTFDDPAKFNLDWALTPGMGTIGLANGEVATHLDAADGAAFIGTKPDFMLNNCGIWAEIVQATAAPDVMVRLSVGAPMSLSYYNIGVRDKNLEVHITGMSVFSTPYLAAQMRHVRIRAATGKVYFDYSADGRCWTEAYNTTNTAPNTVEGRLSVSHTPNGPGTAADGRFDNYCVTPP